MNLLLEVWRVLNSVFRRLVNPEEHPLTIREMAWLYIQKKINPYPQNLPSIEVPFAFAESITSPSPLIAVIVHCYYPDVMDELLTYIRHIPYDYRLFVSTDTEEKRREIIQLIDKHPIIDAEVRLAPNRGRDIAPKYIAFRDVYQHCEYFLHLHSKKTPQAGSWGDTWREYLLRTLVGSPEIIRSNIQVLADPRIGLVFPIHLNGNLPEFRWGYNFTKSRPLAERLNVEISPYYCLDYPQGSMFWGKTDAIRPILDLQLQPEDFPIEKGQLDGGLHHVLERMVAYSAHKQGLASCRVCVNPATPNLQGVRGEADLASAISICLAAQNRERLWFEKLFQK